MEPLGIPVEWGLLLVLAVAVGTDLYLSLLTLAVLPHVLVGADPPGRLGFVSGPWVGISSAILYALGWAVGIGGRWGLVWSVFHLPVKMAAAGALALLLFPGQIGWDLWPAVAAGAGVAGSVHGLRLGWRLILDHGAGLPVSAWLRALAEDTLVVGLLWITFSIHIAVGLAAAATALLILLLLAGPSLRAALFTYHLLRGVARHALGFSDLRPAERLPGWIRRAVNEGSGTEVSGVRGMRAAVAGLAEGGAFRTGWFVHGPRGPAFLYRTPGRIREVDLVQGPPSIAPERGGVIKVTWQPPAEGFALLVPLGAPLEELRRMILPPGDA